MIKSGEITLINLNKKIKQVYKERNLNEDKVYTFKLNCTKNDKGYIYFFEIYKDSKIIYKRVIDTCEPGIVHSYIYDMIFYFFNKQAYQYSTLNNNSQVGILRIYFVGNFKIEVTYDNDCDKLFFENLFLNYKSEVLEYRFKKEKKLLNER